MHENGFIGAHGGFLGWGIAWQHAPWSPMHPVSFMASFHKVWVVWGSFWVLRSIVLEYVTSSGMDADTQGLASALALLGIYNVADLVELAHTGSLVEMILTACGAARSGAACH